MQRFRRTVHKLVRLRMVKYYLLGNVSLVANFGLYNVLLWCGVAVTVAYAIAYFVGGQMNFWIHDRKTFGDRNPELGDWHYRWLMFMGVNLTALGLTTGVAWVLNRYGWPHLAVYAGSMIAGAIYNFIGNNFVSHRDRSATIPSVERSNTP